MVINTDSVFSNQPSERTKQCEYFKTVQQEIMTGSTLPLFTYPLVREFRNGFKFSHVF